MAGIPSPWISPAFPHARCTGVDIDPIGLAAARRAVKDAELQARVQILEGDVGSVVSPESFDVVVMVEVLHEIDPGIRGEVVRSCTRALKTGGWLVIVDETYPSNLAQARQPDYRAAA